MTEHALQPRAKNRFVRQAWLYLILGCMAPQPGRGETVTWMISYPVDSNAKKTMGTEQLTFLTAHLPDFSHAIISASAARMLHELQYGLGVCSPEILVTPEREKALLFPKRRMGLSGFRVMMRRDRLKALAPAIDGRGEMNLAELDEMPNLVGAYRYSRNYGPAISGFIQQHASNGLRGEMANFQLFSMVESGRVDFAFVLPMDYYLNLPEEQRGDVVLLRVMGEPPIIYTATACSNDRIGRDTIHAIDALLADETRWSEYLEPFRKWLPPEEFEILSSGR